MKRFGFILVALILLFAVTNQSRAVDFEEQIKKLAETNAIGYVGPFSTAFGTAMNSGLYHTAKPHGILGFDISFKATVVSVPEESQTFNFLMGDMTLSGLNPNLGLPNNELTINLDYLYPDREVPTVFGEDQPGVIAVNPEGASDALVDALARAGKSTAEITSIQNGSEWNSMLSSLTGAAQDFETPPGIGINALPLIMPQVSLGLPFKTEVMVRMIPDVEVTDVGTISFLGIGVKHNLDQYIPIPLFPVTITGQFAWQSLNIGDIIESNHMAYNLQASKKFGFGLSITPYVGLGLESSTMSVTYTVDAPGQPYNGQDIAFDLDGDNKFRLTGGVRFAIPLVTLNADYSLGEFAAYSVGLGITLR